MNTQKHLVYYLLPNTPVRLAAKEEVLAGKITAERFLFYGLHLLRAKGVPVADNIKPRGGKMLSNLMCIVYDYLMKIAGKSLGGSLWTILDNFETIKKATLILCYSERVGIPLLFLRHVGVLPTVPIIYMPIGLPEKLADIRFDWVRKRFLAELRGVEKILCVSKKECDVLREDYQIAENVEFVCAGVDTDYFHPVKKTPEVDVLSIGADKYRDFDTLLKAAKMLPQISFEVITSKYHASKFTNAPDNMEVIFDVPMDTIKDHISRAQMLALPVYANIYSGATTVMLQAMAMGKPVIANKVGANKDEYPFEDQENCIFIDVQAPDQLKNAICMLLDDRETGLKIGSNARETVKTEIPLDNFHEYICKLINRIYFKHWNAHLFSFLLLLLVSL